MRKLLLILAAGAVFFATTANAESPRVAGEPVWANGKAAAQSAARKVKLGDVPAVDVARVSLGPMAQGRIDELRTNNAQAVNKALQVGINRDLREEGIDAQPPVLSWKSLPDGARAARFSVTSPGALALRLGLNFRDIQAGTELRFLGANDGDVAVAVANGEEIARLHKEQPLYWTPVTEGESQMVEIYLPSGAAIPRFTIDSVSHLVVSPWGNLSRAKIGQSQPCERDVSCAPQTGGFVNAKNAVARMLFTALCPTLGTCSCTGTLLNDTDITTQIPYFYGANHCISTQTEASTLTTLWFEESTSCGSGIASARTQIAGGAALLYNDYATDASLLRLNNAPPSGAFFSGWDPAVVTAGTNVTVIHHPMGDVKKVSLGQILGFATLSELGGNFITVGYNSGTTEVGSSGSGIFSTDANGDYYWRGGLTGGPAACGNSGNLSDPDNRDYYSRFDHAYPHISRYLAAAAAQPDYTGAWYNANENGWGLSVVRGASGAAYFIVMYHYDQFSNPTWYFMSGGSFSGTTYTAPVYVFSGPWFGITPFNPAAVVGGASATGTVSISFTSATSATLSYTIGGTTVSNKSITKVAF